MEKGERQRLWELLFREALERGADAFSIQPDTTYASSGPTVGSEPLMLYLRSVPPRWRWSLRPPAWPLDDESRRWLRALGARASKITLWAGKLWVLRTDLWGRTVTFVLPRDGWEGLRRRLAAVLGEVPDHFIQRWRGLEPREAGGWAAPKRLRWALFVIAALVGLGVSALFGWEEGLGAALLAVAVPLALPQHEPTVWDRLMVRTGSLTDPVYRSRLRLALSLGSIGVVLSFLGSLGAGLSEQGSAWRSLFWALAALGGLMVLVGSAPAAAWLWRRRGRGVEAPTTSQ
jgi:hypothetical protein